MENTPKKALFPAESDLFPLDYESLEMQVSQTQLVTKPDENLENVYLGTGLEIRRHSQRLGANQDVSKTHVITGFLSNRAKAIVPFFPIYFSFQKPNKRLFPCSIAKDVVTLYRNLNKIIQLMKQLRTPRRANGLLTRFALTALLLSFTATASPYPSRGGENDPSQVMQDDEPQKDKRKITGQIVDEQGEPLIGAGIAVKGTDEKALTDLSGKFTIATAEPSPTLVFTYMGYKTKEVAAGDHTVVNVKMEEDQEELSEVIVTALGIKREKKLLGYAVQDLQSEQLNLTGDPSVTSALSGKIAGVEMNTAPTGRVFKIISIGETKKRIYCSVYIY